MNCRAAPDTSAIYQRFEGPKAKKLIFSIVFKIFSVVTIKTAIIDKLIVTIMGEEK